MNVRVLFLAVVFSVAALTVAAQAQAEIVLSPASNRELREGEKLCGNYFVVREGGGERMLVFRLGISRTRAVFWISFPTKGFVVRIDETMAAPVARMVFGRKNEGVRNIEVRLSRADYEAAQGCLPAPRKK